MKDIYSQIDRLYSEMVNMRRYFHQHPELSFQEVETPEGIAAYLEELGVEVQRNVGGRGVVGYIRGNKPGKTVALRADFDALPIQDDKDVPYRSTVPGVMHACGHDAHTAILLAVAKVLSGMTEELSGNVVLIHQFAEELAPGGALPMIEDHCLEGVDAIFGTHVWTPLPIGTIGVRAGAIMASADKFEIEIIGRGGHGASPHETVDPIVVGTTVIQQLQQIISRRINPLHPAVLTVATFHAGQAFNVIPTSASISGTVRTLDKNVQQQIIEQMEKIISTICEGAGANYRFDYSKGYPPVINHSKETDRLAKISRQVVGSANTIEVEPNMGGEDFAYYLQKVPGAFFFTGAGNPDTGAAYPHHHSMFDIDEKSMLIAAKVLLSTALDYLNT